MPPMISFPPPALEPPLSRLDAALESPLSLFDGNLPGFLMDWPWPCSSCLGTGGKGHRVTTRT